MLRWATYPGVTNQSLSLAWCFTSDCRPGTEQTIEASTPKGYDVNAIFKAQNAYKNSAQPIRTHRDTEYNAFAKITRRLRAATGDGLSGFKELADALQDNRRLWTILAGDVADNDNPLPSQLRAQIIYLSQFTQAHSRQVLAGKANADPLVEINIAIMKGLRNMEVGS